MRVVFDIVVEVVGSVVVVDVPVVCSEVDEG
jgi:hypothetical protein